MEEIEKKYVKRTQKDYSMSLKLAIVREYEKSKVSMEALQEKYGIQGNHTINTWVEKFGSFDKNYIIFYIWNYERQE